MTFDGKHCAWQAEPVSDIDTLRIGQGLPDIRFGCMEADVVAELGAPDSRTENEDDDLLLVYDLLGLEFIFWSDFDLRLGQIGTRRPTAELRDERPIGWTLDQAKDFIANRLVADISELDARMEEEGHVQSWIEVESHGLTFWFEDGYLYLVDWESNWYDDDRPDWWTG